MEEYWRGETISVGDAEWIKADLALLRVFPVCPQGSLVFLFRRKIVAIQSKEISTYYKCSNNDIGSTEQKLINIFEHEVYTFYIIL